MTMTTGTATPSTPPVSEAPLRAPAPAVLNPTQLTKPAFLLSVPFCYSTAVANNAWMQELSDEERAPDFKKAMRQFLELYHFVASEALVYLAPSPGDCDLQDLVFTANLGCVLEHDPGRKTVVISNFTSEPRIGEADVGVSFFEALGYDVVQCPHKFEGEAELKHLYDNVYVGGYGIRSDFEAFEWMEEQFDMKIIKVEEVEPYLYHLDCSIFPITRDETLVCTELFSDEEVAELEKHTGIIDVSADECFSGICNSVRLSNTILNGSHIHDLKAGTEDYAEELRKNRRLEDIAVERGFEVNYFNLSEYLKGGALLSCMMMHLNRHSYEFTLI
jgi:N-dimethylarginine dimethylaminohydrolase